MYILFIRVFLYQATPVIVLKSRMQVVCMLSLLAVLLTYSTSYCLFNTVQSL